MPFKQHIRARHNDGFGYKSEDECTFTFNGDLDYNGGANDDLLIGSAADNGGADYFLSGEIEEVIQEIDSAIKAEHALVKRIFVEAEPA